MEETTAQATTENKKAIDPKVALSGTLDQLMQQPTRYEIDVIDKRRLPDHMKKRKVIEFIIKPPVLSTLAKVAKVAALVPEELPKKMTSFEHVDKMAKIMAILAHGNSKGGVPTWYQEFMVDNCTPMELTKMLQETTLKMGTDFFLHFFQIAKQMNPMMMPVIPKIPKKKDSTQSD